MWKDQEIISLDKDLLRNIHSLKKVKLVFSHNAILLWTLFPWHTSDYVSLAPHGVDTFHVYKITIKDLNIV